MLHHQEINLSTTLTLSVSQAQRHIQDAMKPITDVEHIKLVDALNRIAADDIRATINVPAFDNSAMDGYAFCAQDLASNDQLKIVGNALAGAPYQAPVKMGEAIRITTGAKMPERCDSVLPQEQAVLVGQQTLNMKNITVHAGQHRRLCGEDLTIGDVPISKGHRLGAAELGLLASLGIAHVKVQRRVRVALYSTGNELRSENQHLDNASGSIYDSNRITLQSMLRQFGADVMDLGILSDDADELKTALANIAPQVDAIITSGGIAGGAADFTKKVIQELGEITSLSIKMRPGRSLVFGKIHHANHSTYVFGLPGNPVAVMVSFYFFIRPALQVLQGAQVTLPLQINAIAAQRIEKKFGRTEFQRGICDVTAQGQLQVHLTKSQGSGVLSSMTQANCFVVLQPKQGDVAEGEIVKVVLFRTTTAA